MSKGKKTGKTGRREEPVKLDMTFNEALKKALNTPLPKKQKDKKKPRTSN